MEAELKSFLEDIRSLTSGTILSYMLISYNSKGDAIIPGTLLVTNMLLSFGIEVFLRYLLLRRGNEQFEL